MGKLVQYTLLIVLICAAALVLGYLSHIPPFYDLSLLAVNGLTWLVAKIGVWGVGTIITVTTTVINAIGWINEHITSKLKATQAATTISTIKGTATGLVNEKVKLTETLTGKETELSAAQEKLKKAEEAQKTFDSEKIRLEGRVHDLTVQMENSNEIAARTNVLAQNKEVTRTIIN